MFVIFSKITEFLRKNCIYMGEDTFSPERSLQREKTIHKNLRFGSFGARGLRRAYRTALLDHGLAWNTL